jgi:hypothetical protein
VFDMPGRPPNIARFTFLDERAHEFYPDWGMFADVTVAILRTEAGRDPHNKELHDLIGELHPQYGVPHAVGRARCAPPRRRIQDLPPSRRRRDDARL